MLKFNVYNICIPTTKDVCLFGWGLSSHPRIFNSYGDVSIACKGLLILTYARHLWPMNSGVSLACHTYCETGHPLITVISITTCSNDYEHTTIRLQDERFNRLRNRWGSLLKFWTQDNQTMNNKEKTVCRNTTIFK